MSYSQKLNKGWRIFATGFCFVMFGFGGLLLTFVLFPLLNFSTSSPEKRKKIAQKTISSSFSFFCKMMRFLGTIDYKLDGFEKLYKDKNTIIIANHPSLIDYVLIVSQLPECDCLVKDALWKNFFLKGVVKAAGYIPNKAPEDLITVCKDSNTILVFPEGTRTRENSTAKLQRGAAQIAIKSNKNLRLIHISVTPRFLTKEKKWYHVPKTKPLFHLQVMNLIKVAPFIDEGTPLSVSVRHLNLHLTDVLHPNKQEK